MSYDNNNYVFVFYDKEPIRIYVETLDEALEYIQTEETHFKPMFDEMFARHSGNAGINLSPDNELYLWYHDMDFIPELVYLDKKRYDTKYCIDHDEMIRYENARQYDDCDIRKSTGGHVKQDLFSLSPEQFKKAVIAYASNCTDEYAGVYLYIYEHKRIKLENHCCNY